MNKRGSHVGMIISFVIFITFIVFLYSVFKPAINTGENKKAILDVVEKGLLENISVNLTTATVQVKNRYSQYNCIELQGFLLTTTLSGIDSGYIHNLKVKDGSENILNANSGGSIGSDLIINNNNENTFFKVYFSTNFTTISVGSSCTTVPSTDFNVGSITTDSFPFESKINYLAGYYTNNYDKLKAELKITPGNYFGFDFTKSDGTVGASVGTPPKTANVFTDEVPIQYVDSKANILSGFINIKVW